MPDSKITIGHVSLHSCVRAHKIAWAWADETKNKVVLFTEMVDNRHHNWWLYDACVKLYKDNKGAFHPWQYEMAVKTPDPIIDVWHVHNEPDWPVWVLRKHTKKPIIYDIHDLRSVREGQSEENEDKAFEAADAFSVVSRNYMNRVIKRTQTKPVREVLSCVPKGMFPKERVTPYSGGIVYEGGLGNADKAEFKCRAWSDVFGKIEDLGIQMWAYTANPAVKGFRKTIIKGPIPYINMLQELTAHEFALIGSPEPDPMFDGALPNKLFEYMCAGLPMICMNAPDVSQFLMATGMGVTVNDVKDIPDAMQYMRDRKFRKTVWTNRWSWTQESQIPKVTWLYEKVLGRSLQKPIVPGEFKKEQS